MMRQEDPEFGFNLGYITRSCKKTKNKNKKDHFGCSVGNR
jgi:hypothetical protein